MTTKDHQSHSQRGSNWHRWAFLILAIAPLLLAAPLFVRNPLSETVALVVGGVGGVALISILDHDSRRVALSKGDGEHFHEPVTIGRSEPAYAYVRYKGPTLASSARSGAHRAPDSGVSGNRVLDKVAPVGPVRSGRTLPPDLRAIDPPVLEGGTAAGRSPWRLPINQTQSGIAADAARLGDLEVRAASVIGPGHRCYEPATARQDAYALMRPSSGSHLIVAVADGLSSSTNSEIGARVAVSAAARTLHRALEVSPDPERLAADALFNEVAGEMVGTGRSRAIDDRALCSLLIVAVIPVIAQPDGSRRVWTAQIGDVSLWLHGRNGWSQRTGKSKSGLDRNQVNAVLPFNPEQVVSGFVDVQPGQSIAVMTDGLGDTLNDVATAKPFFAARWARPPHLAGFVSDLCFDARGQNDDRTAVVVWCGQNT